MLKQFLIFGLIIHLVTASSAFSTTTRNFTMPDYSKSVLTNNSIRNPKDTAKQLPSHSIGIKDNLTHQSLKNILLHLLTIRQGKIGAILDTFSNDYTNWSWMLKEDSLPKNVNGQTTITRAGVLTTLDYNKLQKATNLSVARTMIHEMIHAYFLLYYRNDLLDARKSYPQIYNACKNDLNFDCNRVQHEEMEKYFVNDIAAALKEYGKSMHLKINNSVYTDLAWGGLDIENSIQLSDMEKERIESRLVAEQLNRQVDNQKPEGITLTDSTLYRK